MVDNCSCCKDSSVLPFALLRCYLWSLPATLGNRHALPPIVVGFHSLFAPRVLFVALRWRAYRVGQPDATNDTRYDIVTILMIRNNTRYDIASSHAVLTFALP